MDPYYAARQQQRLQQFQQQQMLHEQNEYAAYFGVLQQSPPLQSPPLYLPQPLYSHHPSPSAYLPYATTSNLDDVLPKSGHDILHEDYGHVHDMIMQQQEQDPWNELAEWYWSMYNDHESLLDPIAAQNSARQDSYDSGNSPTDQSVAAIDQKPALPEKPFRDQLIHLYFVHVHPLCPVFDEHEFCEAYEASEDGLSVLQQNVITLLEFQAMLFAGALHLSPTQLGNTNYTGTHECHRALFKAAKITYHACQHENRIAATRAAILLSLWAPYNSDHSNSYWVDQALANAQAANLSDMSHQPALIPVGRRKLIWMSCLRRDRYLAFASRRSTRLASCQQNTSMSITREDYGLEALQPHFMSLVAKWASIENFAQQCELSQIMLRLLKFQRARGFDQGHEWAAGVDGAQLLEAIGIDSQMEAWRTGVRWEFLEGRHMGIGNCDAPIRLTAIQYESAIAFLYLPYIYVRPGVKTAISPEFSAIALEKVKKACSNIARTSEFFVIAANANDIPLSLGAWILLPIVMKLVFLNTSPIQTATSPPASTSHYDNSSSSGSAGPSSHRHNLSNSSASSFNPSNDLHEMRTLMTLLYIIKSRYSGGEFVSTLLDTVMNRLNEERKNRERRNEDRGDLGLLQEAAEVIDRALASRVLLGGNASIG